jgi:hypothetical protein
METKVKGIEITDWGLIIVMNDKAIIDNSTAIPTMKYILDKCKEFNKDKVIVEEQTIERQISVMTILSLTELIKLECPRLKLAFVASHLVDHPDSKTMDTFAFNRGAKIQYFHDMDSAKEWIIK